MQRHRQGSERSFKYNLIRWQVKASNGAALTTARPQSGLLQEIDTATRVILYATAIAMVDPRKIPPY